MPSLQRFLVSLFCLGLVAVSAFGETGGKLTMKSGAVMEYSEAHVEGGEIVLKLPYGMMRLPVSLVAEESLLRVGGSPALFEPAPSPAPAGIPNSSEPASAKVQDSPAVTPAKEEPPEQPVFLAPAPVMEQQAPRPELWKFLPQTLSARQKPGVNFKTKLVEFNVTGKLFENPKVKVQCLVPVDDGGHPVPSAADVVFYAPYQNQKDPVVTDKFVRGMAEIYGMTVFSLTIKTNQEFFEDLEKCYYYAESGSYEMVLQAWDKVVEQLRLPRKNLLILANSAGSTMAERFALLNDSRVDAVSMIGGWRYEPMVKPNGIVWSVLCTRGDVREQANAELAAQARSLGVSMLQAVTPLSATKKDAFAGQYTSSTFHHVASESAFDIGQQFLATVRDMRNAKMKDPQRWPVTAPADCQWAVTKSDAPQPLTQAAYFPSESFAATWLRNENRYVLIPSTDGGSRAALVRYPQGDNPKGIIIYGGGATEMIDRGDDMDFLGLQGFLVVGTPDEGSGTLDDARELLKWVTSLEQWKSYPIYLLGFNEAGRNFLSLLPETERVRSAAAIDSPLLPASDAFPKTSQRILVSSLESASADEEPFQSYLKRASAAGANASVISPNASSKLLRFDLLEEIATRFSP
jgi:pimeloyl-ACP methyl ester carboxylesterase